MISKDSSLYIHNIVYINLPKIGGEDIVHKFKFWRTNFHAGLGIDALLCVNTTEIVKIKMMV